MANQQTGSGGPKAAAVPIPRSRRGLKGFLAEVGREMKKVNWPSKAETNRLTGVVFAVCFLVGAILLALSFVFDTLVSIITKGGA